MAMDTLLAELVAAKRLVSISYVCMVGIVALVCIECKHKKRSKIVNLLRYFSTKIIVPNYFSLS